MSKLMRGLSRVVLALATASIAVASIAADAPAKPAAKQPGSKEVERGRYLVLIGGCHDCHTPGFLVNGDKTPAKDYLVGGTLGGRGPWGTTYPANLRLYFQDLTEDQWVQLAKEVQRRPPMPYFSLNAMAEADVRGVYKYILSLGPAGVQAPAFVPPDKEPPKPVCAIPRAVKPRILIAQTTRRELQP